MSKVYVLRDQGMVELPVGADGAWIRRIYCGLVTTGVCYEQFRKITGIKLKDGVVTLVEIKGKIIKELPSGSPKQ